MRLDNYLVENGYFETRNKAQQAIKSNRIKVNNKLVTKTGFNINFNDKVDIEKIDYEFVSRGGYKLLKAIKEFNLNFKDKVIMDLGASTGGFTDCAIQFGAKKVYAIDVGSNQLAPILHNNPKIISIENKNVKDLEVDEYKDIDYIVMDLSFISITKLLDILDNLLYNDKILLIALIKPQFEAENRNINKNGLVKDKKIHINILNKIITSFYDKGMYLNNLSFSPIKGEKSGNIEYLALISKNKSDLIFDIAKIVDLAYKNLL